MKINVNYSEITGEILGCYPSDVDYASIPTPNIEVDEGTWKDCINNQGNRIVDIINKVIITGNITRVQTVEEVKEAKITTLKNLLSSTDYQLRKLVEGVITAEQYAPLKGRSQEWRDAINALEVATTLEAVNAIRYSIDIPEV